MGELLVFGIEIGHPLRRVILKRPDLLSTSIHDCHGFASGHGDHLVCFVEGSLGDLAGFAFGFDASGLEELFGLGAYGIAGLGRFIEDQTGGFFACLVELLIQGSSPLALIIESLRRLRFLVGGSFQLTLKFGDVVFGSHHLLVKLVEVPINLAWDNVLIDRAESRPMWCVSP
jgi:hypothetical protein